jgi:methylmalonyl-CoA mutase N-terminal domain/subunit
MQDEIAKSAYEYQRQIEHGEKIIVGVNKFQTDEKNTIPVFKIEETVQTHQTEKIKALKSKRDNDKVAASLQALHAYAVSGQNLMPVVLEAVENYCTLGEIADELRKVFGEYK